MNTAPHALTPEQRVALDAARDTLAEAQADRQLAPGTYRGDAYWVGRLQRALLDVTAAWPEGGAS